MSLKESCKHFIKCIVIIIQNWEGGLHIVVSKIAIQNQMPKISRSLHSVFEQEYHE